MTAAAASLGPAAARAAANTGTWLGAGSSDTWSTPANWAEGTSPSGTVGELTLPAASPSCRGWACSYGVDDIPALTVGRLQIDSSTGYLIAPYDGTDRIQLLNGLSFGTAVPASGRLLTKLVVPLVLGAAQTWSLDGVPGVPSQLTLGAVTGESSPLTIALADDVALAAPEIDTGPLTLTGSGSVSLATGTVGPRAGATVAPPPLLGTRGVRLARGADLRLILPGTVTGPITVAPGSYSRLEIGDGVAPDGTVVSNGDVTLRADSTLQLWIDQPATVARPASPRRPARGGRSAALLPTPSYDFSQLTVLGTLRLNDAGLALSQGYSSTQVECAALRGGQPYTLIAAGRLVGSFSGIANGQVVPLGACNPVRGGPGYAAIISYDTRSRPETVTAQLVGPAQVRALVARTLTLPPAAASAGSLLRDGGHTTTFDAPSAGALALTWSAMVRHRRVIVAAGSCVAARVGRRRVAIRLTAAGRRLLRRHRRLALTATAAFTPTGQAQVVVARHIDLGR